jgi:glycosyltransferase involved in cell wall biosynthesis
MGRLHHLRQTLPHNIEIAHSFPETEFVLLDYNSPDDLEGWIFKELEQHILSGKLKYYKTTEPTSFFMSHAKNVSHKLAVGDIICNVDADTYLEPEFIAILREVFETKDDMKILAPAMTSDFSGRIALPKRWFEVLGGYNEDFKFGWGCDDDDFRRRAILFGLREYVFDQKLANYIGHSNEERVANSICKDMEFSKRIHLEMSEANIKQGILVANQGRSWGVAKCMLNTKCDRRIF